MVLAWPPAVPLLIQVGSLQVPAVGLVGIELAIGSPEQPFRIGALLMVLPLLSVP